MKPKQMGYPIRPVTLTGWLAGVACLALISSAAENPQDWLAAGRVYERFALTATSLGIRTALMNQPIEVPELRGELAKAFDLGDRQPQMLVRFGYAPEMPRSLRRPLEQVIM